MYEYLDNPGQVRVIGSFSIDKNADFKNSVKSMLESFQSTYQMDAITDITKILRIDTVKEAYKDNLLSDVMESSFDNEYYNLMPQKLEQLFENSGLEMLQESGVAALAPIVGITLPVLKKTYIEGHAKDIVMTEVPTKPIIKAAFERRFLKDTEGNKYYIPDVFYDDTYKTIMNKGKGTEISDTFYAIPVHDFDILDANGGSIARRDSLAYDFGIVAVKMDPKGDGNVITIPVNVQPNMAANSSFTFRVKGGGEEDVLMGQVDFYSGLVSVASTKGLIKEVQFGGHLSNENNNNTIEIDRERELMEWKIPDGHRINTGLTLEKIKDYKALFDFDITTEIIADMSTVLAQTEDSDILGFLHDSYDKWKNITDLPFGYQGGFVETGYFNCEPPSNKFVTRSSWIDTELKFDLNRFVDELKIKLRTQDLMFVIYAHPNNISLIQDNVRWIIDEDTKIGGIQLDYKFGVMTANKNRIHVVSTLKCPKSRGLRVVAYPLTKEVITFKHYKYSLNIENAYRNALTPLTPNIMGTSRYITTEVLPVQGEFRIVDGNFSIGAENRVVATGKVATPTSTLGGNGAVINLPTGASTTVELASGTAGAKIYYTVDGTDPTITSPEYTGAFTVNATTEIKAIAVKDGMLQSDAFTATVNIA